MSVVLNVPYLILFMLVSYLAKKYLESFLQKITNMRWKTVYSVFIIASLLAVPFSFMPEVDHTLPVWVKTAISYCVGTSMHELFFSWVEKKVTNG